MPSVAIYPGSFDPVTNGHIDIAERGLKLFDKIIIAILHNPDKQSLFSVEERLEMLNESMAGIENVDTRMEFAVPDSDSASVAALLDDINPTDQPVLVISPFSRWASKDWSLAAFLAAGSAVADRFRVLVTGAPDKRAEIDSALASHGDGRLVNLAGQLSLTEFAALVKRANLLLTGDSFPMHVAGACATPVVALFGPTDEAKVGPRGSPSRVLRAPGCRRCDRANCARRCLDRIAVDTAVSAITELQLEVSQ